MWEVLLSNSNTFNRRVNRCGFDGTDALKLMSVTDFVGSS